MTSKLRDPLSALTHIGGAVLALAGTIWLLINCRGDLPKSITMLIYGLGLITMFTASGVYHSVKADPHTIQNLRKFDHSAIYLIIAGSYTPICTFYFTGFWKWGLLGIIWGMAIIGILVKLFYINAPRWLTAGIYLLMGWLCIMAIGEMLRNMPGGALAWLIIGGVFYSIGALIYIFKKPDFLKDIFGFHEVFHIFVLLGAFSHYLLMALYIAPG